MTGVVRCECGREQAIGDDEDATPGVRVLEFVPDEESAWLRSFGWRSHRRGWRCPFCASTRQPSNGGAS